MYKICLIDEYGIISKSGGLVLKKIKKEVKYIKFTSFFNNMLDIEKEFKELYMPEIDWTRNEIEKIEKIKDENIRPFIWRVNFFVVEKNIKPKWYEKSRIISKWFYKVRKIKDFQVRDKIATLQIKRRKWYNEDSKKIISEDMLFWYKKQSCDDLVNFFLSSLKIEKWILNYAHCLHK